MSTFKILGPLGLLAVLSWQAQTALVVLVLLVSLAAISFLWRSRGEVWSFLHHARYIQWGSLKIVMRNDSAVEDHPGIPTETKKS